MVELIPDSRPPSYPSSAYDHATEEDHKLPSDLKIQAIHGQIGQVKAVMEDNIHRVSQAASTPNFLPPFLQQHEMKHGCLGPVVTRCNGTLRIFSAVTDGLLSHTDARTWREIEPPTR
jgi:hypothetical protein